MKRERGIYEGYNNENYNESLPLHWTEMHNTFLKKAFIYSQGIDSNKVLESPKVCY